MTNHVQTAPAVFQFQSQEIRTVHNNGELWFLANDVCAILGYANPRRTVSLHCKEGGVTKWYTPTNGDNQEMVYINEPNLYRLIIKSHKPEAEAFEAWVMEELLPTIRKTGSYSLSQNTVQLKVEINRVRYTRFENGEKIYCVKDISVPYFNMDASIWVTELMTDVQHREEFPSYCAIKMLVPDGHSRIIKMWCATRQAIQYMLNKHYQNLPEETRDALVTAFSGNNEPPSAYAEDYPIPTVSIPVQVDPPALIAPQVEPARKSVFPLSLMEDGRYLLAIHNGEMRVKNLAKHNIVRSDIVYAIANNARKLRAQYALLTGDGSKNLLDIQLDDLEDVV